MYKIMFVIFGIVMFCIGTQAYAFGNNTDNSSRASSSARSSQYQGQAQGQLQAQGQVGNTTTVTDNSSYTEKKQYKNTPAFGVAGLTASNITCLGSASVSGVVAGFGIGGGTTVMDDECNVRQISIRFAQLGMDDAAVRVMCQSPAAKLAMANTGYDCKVDADNAPAQLPPTTYTSGSNVGSGFMGR